MIEEDFYKSVAKSSRKVDENLSHLRLNGISLHDILVSDSTDLKMVTLPLLTFNKCPKRLTWNRHNNSVVFLITSFIKHVYHILEEHRIYHDSPALHLLGTIGIGKSAAAYTCCYALRSRQEEKIFVTYISCCKRWIDDKDFAYTYFLIELVQTFYMLDDINSPPKRPDINSVVGWATYVKEVCEAVFDKELWYFSLSQMVTAICDAILKKNFYWFVVFDNHNALYLENDYNTRPYVIINKLMSFFDDYPHHGMLVISSSNINEFYNLKKSNFVHENLVCGALSKFQELQLHHLLIATDQDKYFQYPLSEAVKIIMQCTEGIPIEVLRFCEFKKQMCRHKRDPHDDMKEYLKMRCLELMNEMIEYIKRYCEKVPYHLILIKVLMGVPCTLGDYAVFDKRFVILEYVGDIPLCLLHPVNELVTRAFKQLLYAIDDKVYDDYILNVAKDKYLASYARYNHVENYIIRKMGQCNECELSLKWLDNDGLHYYTDCISFDKKPNIVHFKGLNTPESAFDRQETLYYPDNQQYPAVDFLLFLPGINQENDILWAILVTGSSKPNERILITVEKFHPQKLVCSKNREGVTPELQKQWARYCNIPPKNVMVVWFFKHEPTPCNEDMCLYMHWKDIGLHALCPHLSWFYP